VLSSLLIRNFALPQQNEATISFSSRPALIMLLFVNGQPQNPFSQAAVEYAF
jgi:hypothetical protein